MNTTSVVCDGIVMQFRQVGILGQRILPYHVYLIEGSKKAWAFLNCAKEFQDVCKTVRDYLNNESGDGETVSLKEVVFMLTRLRVFGMEAIEATVTDAQLVIFAKESMGHTLATSSRIREWMKEHAEEIAVEVEEATID